MPKQFFILIFLASFFAQAQEDEEKLYWSTTSLTWEDFKGNPNPNDPYQANTYSGFTFSWSLQQNEEGREFVYDIKSYFLPNQSWVKKGAKNSYLLAHEQLHFDISELHARKFKTTLANFDSSGSLAEVKRGMKSIYQQIEKERKAMQQKYDRETDHGGNKKAQEKWQDFIQKKLQS